MERLIRCCAAALGWSDADPNADFFRWKHRDNHFGPSLIWVAEDRDEIVGVRALMQWRLQRGDRLLKLVRAVDTATLPSHQGRGIFRRLTLAAVEQLEREGYDAVFNTPNEKSRPGYLKMGWTEVGRAPVGLRLRSPLVLPRLARSRTAAEKWGEPLSVGTTVPNFDRLAQSWIAPNGWHTPVSAGYLAWRYGFEPLGYRFVDGGVVRVRRRGAVSELSICDTFGPTTDIGRLLKSTGSDVAVASGLGLRQGFVPADRLGPRLTWRCLASQHTPSIEDLSLSLGTVELF